MISIICALYSEAKPLIEGLSLKKNHHITQFPVYENKNVSLIVSGVGRIRAAIATTFLITWLSERGNKPDLLVNVGICGSLSRKFPIKSIVFPHKIIDFGSQRDYYPEMLWRHPFLEGTLLTSSSVIKTKSELNDKGISDCDIVDMEASGVFEAASLFLPLHSIIFLKIVSDEITYTNEDLLDSNRVLNLITEKRDSIIDYINKLSTQIQEYNKILQPLSDNESKLLEDIINRLKFTKTMASDIKKIAVYYKLNGGDLIKALLPFLEEDVKSKREVIENFNILKDVLIKP